MVRPAARLSSRGGRRKCKQVLMRPCLSDVESGYHAYRSELAGFGCNGVMVQVHVAGGRSEKASTPGAATETRNGILFIARSLKLVVVS